MKKQLVLFGMAGMLAIPAARACDLCAIYIAQEATETRPGPSLGFSIQYSHFDTVIEDGDHTGNTAGEELDSWITQGILGYRFNHRIGMQLAVPYIDRSFDQSGARGHEWGLGYIAALALWRAVELLQEDRTLILDLFGGIEIPTGDSDRLEEDEHHHAEEDDEEGGHEDEAKSGLHGHDLALGSGSWDAVLGVNTFGRAGRWFARGALQYALRTEGDHDYEFGDDLWWSLASGWYARLDHAGTLGLGAHLSGEIKEEDERSGHAEPGTEVTMIYAGPVLTATARDRWSAELAVDLPVYEDNEGVTLVPDTRVRAGVTRRF